MQCLRLAGYKLRIEGYRLENMFEVYDVFDAFEEPDDGLPPDLTAEIVTGHDDTAHLMPDAPHSYAYKSAFFRQSAERLLVDMPDDLFPHVEISNDYALTRHFFNHRRYQSLSEDKKGVDFHFFLELRRQLIGYLHCRGNLMLHSVSVLYDGAAFALSAPSETGKTTHAQLWVDHFGAKIIDGDCNACRIVGGKPYIYGLPWCGSSGITHNERAPLRAVVFLERGEVNEARRLSPAESVMRLAARSYLPRWDASLMGGDYLKPAERLAQAVPCWALRCRPDREAAEVLRECLY